ncbi:MAG: hypothetical protein K0B02_03960 [DPANN group archaeon]|nr:hypothetical protein [DPANN group archaeon]
MSKDNSPIVSISILLLLSMTIFALSASLLWVETIGTNQSDSLSDLIIIQKEKISSLDQSQDLSNIGITDNNLQDSFISDYSYK